MRQVDLSTVDLNLLKLFDALARDRSVTRAGLRLGLSQPAASRALHRLRTALNDPLVVRGRSGLELTPRAEMLTGPVGRLLDDAQTIYAPATFDPARATGVVSIAALDHLALLVAPDLMARLEQQAPLLRIAIAPPVGDNIALVERGAVDLAIGIFNTLPAGMRHRRLYEDAYACIVRRGHPAAAAGAMTLQRYLASRHIAVTISGIGESPIDAALSKRSLHRQVALRVPHFLVAGLTVADSDMVFTLPRHLASRLARSLPLEIVNVPLRLPRIAPTMIWHERLQHDPAHTWIRQQIADITAAFRKQRA